MKKLIFILTVLISAFAVLSCENELTVKKEGTKKEKKVSKGNERSGAVDPYDFTDVTLKSMDAKKIKVTDFSSVCNGSYCNYKENTKITVQADEKKIIYEDLKDKIEISFSYDLKAASSNLLYILPFKNTKSIYKKNGYENELKKFEGYISLYGFGEGRIEVSDHLKGMSLIKSGTYWKSF